MVRESDLWVAEICKHSLPSSLRMLDIGIGSGESIGERISILGSYGYEVYLTGVDPLLSFPQIARHIPLASDLNLMRFEEYTTDKKFNVINATHSLYYLQNLQENLRKMIRFTIKGGIFLATLWSESCCIYKLHKKVFGERIPPVTGESVNKLLVEIGDLKEIKIIKFEGLVNFAKWRASIEILEAALTVISRQPIGSKINPTLKDSFLNALNELPPVATRTNIIIIGFK